MLIIENLHVSIAGHTVAEVEKLELANGQRIGFVGESGSGKSMIVMSILGLQPKSAKVTGSIKFNGVELIGIPAKKLADIRGRLIGLVPQDPTKSLNPTMRIGKQIAEAISLHSNAGKKAILRRVRELIDNVRLPDPDRIIKSYPHQLSGGQQQRVLIAIAIACEPKLLIADEPTTALDVTVQGEILNLLLTLSKELDMGLLFVSHELGVVRFVCQKVAVIYGGQVAEFGNADSIIKQPAHRYTDALIAANISLPRNEIEVAGNTNQLHSVRGSVPSIGEFPDGCRYRNRCDFAIDSCRSFVPMRQKDKDHYHRCCNPISSAEKPNVTH